MRVIRPDEVQVYRERWDALLQPPSAMPYALPGWFSHHVQRIGLPPSHTRMGASRSGHREALEGLSFCSRPGFARRRQGVERKNGRVRRVGQNREVMSVAMYSGQVNRLSGEIATLRSKLADERKRLVDANGKALRAAEAFSKVTSQTQLSSKARELERHQKAAASLEKKAADLEKSIAAKQKSLSSAEASLERAHREQHRKDEREADRRRKADLDHVKAMERERRAVTALPESVLARPAQAPIRPADSLTSSFTDTYDVCLSFAGEQRDYVQRIASELKAAGLSVFYDQDEDIAPKLWGKDLGEYLDYIYRQGSRFCVMFISADYADKAWTRHERRSTLARVIEEGGEYLLPARFDDTELPGLHPTIGYLDLRQVAPATLVDFVLKKLEAAQP